MDSSINGLLDLLNSIFGTNVTSDSGTAYYLFLIFGFILFLYFIKLLLTLIYSMFGINRK